MIEFTDIEYTIEYHFSSPPKQKYNKRILIDYTPTEKGAMKIGSILKKKAEVVNWKEFEVTITKPKGSDYYGVYITPPSRSKLKKGRKPKGYIGSIQQAQEIFLIELLDSESQVTQRLKIHQQFQSVFKALRTNQSHLEVIYIDFRSSYASFLKDLLVNKDTPYMININKEKLTIEKFKLFEKGVVNYIKDIEINRKNILQIERKVRYEFMRKIFEDNYKKFEEIMNLQREFWRMNIGQLIQKTREVKKYLPIDNLWIKNLNMWNNKFQSIHQRYFTRG